MQQLPRLSSTQQLPQQSSTQQLPHDLSMFRISQEKLQSKGQQQGNPLQLGSLEYHDWDISTDEDVDILELWESTSSTVYPSSESESTAISTSESTASNSNLLQPPPFTTPPKLKPIEQVLADNPGSSVANLRNLALCLARDAIFGRDEMGKCSLSGRKNTCSFDEKTMEYIKTVVR